MGDLADHQRIGGEIVHISDCYVWAEIYYLNSTSDYREYIPRNGADGPRSISLDNGVPLEFSERAPRRGAQSLWSLMGFLCVLLICGLVCYGVFEVFACSSCSNHYSGRIVSNDVSR